jgi:rubrerythrin
MAIANIFRAISIGVTAILLSTSLSISPAQADDLSDAKASLAAAQSKMDSLKLSLTNSQNELKTLTTKLSSLDTNTATAEVIQQLNTQIDATKAAIGVFESQVPKVQAIIDPLVIQIKALEAAINAGNNCPVDWGLDKAKFSVGIESGSFTFDSKVLAEIVKEPRNVVVNTKIEFSKNNQTWTTLSNISTYSWTDYGNNFRYNQNAQTMRFMSGGINALRYADSQIRAITTIEKQNCTPFVLSPDSKPFTLAAIPFAKVTFDELYKTFPEAFPNYQVRDFFTNLVTTIKTDFPAKASGGSSYYLGNSYQYNSQLVIYPRSGSCTGDINNITVQAGSSCEIGIYWVYGSNLRFIDSVSAVGGLSEAQVEQAAMLKILNALTTTVEVASRKYSEIVSPYSDLTEKYLNNGGQPTPEELQFVRNAIDQFNALSIEFSSYQSQITPIVKSKYLNQELNMLVQRNLRIINGTYSSLQNLVPQANDFINQFTSANSSVTNELNVSRQLISMSKNEYSVAVNYQQKLNSVLSSGGSFDSQYINEELNNLQNLINNTSSRISSVKSSLAKSAKLKSSKLNATSLKILDEAISNFNSVLSLYSSISSIYVDLMNKLRNSNSAGTAQANNFLKNADASYSNAKAYFSSASTELKEYPIMISNGKIQLKTSADFDREINARKSMMNKVDQTAQDNRNQIAMAQKYLSSTSNSQEQQIWNASIDQYNQSNNLLMSTIKVYSQIISFVTSKRSGTTDNSILELDGEEEDVTGTVTAKKESSSRYLISVKSNQSDSEVTVKAVKARAKAIVFNISTDDEGNKVFRTTRKLTGYVIQLWVDGSMISSTKKLA